MSDILFHVSTEPGGEVLLPLMRAAARAGSEVAAFFTHRGVIGLRDPALVAALAGSRAVVCEHSWDRYCPGLECPVERGSQTINSALMGEARRVVSL